MATGMQVWSKTAASNNSADSSVNWAEGMAPSAVNDSSRGEMASVAKWRDDNNGSLAGTLSVATYSVTSNQVAGALTAGYTIAFQLGSDLPATALLNLDALGAKPLRPVPNVEFAGGEYLSGQIVRAAYFTSNSGEWIVIGHRKLGSEANAVVTANITANAVTLAKLATQADQTILGNVSGGAAVPTALTIGAGLTGASGTLKSAFAPPAAFKNLSIKVASTTTVTAAADFVTTTDGTTYQTTAVSSTVNLATTGADALDTGTIAIDTWYYIWVVVKADGTTKCVASTSSTAPTMPATYTFKARVGAVRTIHGSATLYGTWQLGRRAQYKVGLAQTSTLVLMSAANTADLVSGTAISISSFVPTTASEIQGFASGVNGAIVMAGPNNSNGGYNSTTNPMPFVIASGGGGEFSFVLESTNIYWGSNATAQIYVTGWVDNI